MSAKAAAACWLTAGIAYPTLEFLAARAISGYRYDRDFISDLGRRDSPLSHLMNTAFVVQGSLFFAGAALLVRNGVGRRRRAFVSLAGLNAIGNLAVASVPSGPSGIAWIHVTGAVLAIVGGNAAIVVGSRLVFGGGDDVTAHRTASVVTGVVGLLSFAALAVSSTTATTVVFPAAVWERLSVYTITGWELMAALALLSRRGATLRR